MSLAFMVFLYLFLIATALVISAIGDILSAVITLSVFGILLATAFAILQAPDVALTQAVINSGIVTALFLVAFSQTERPPCYDKEEEKEE
ncbi:MAG TPA: multidrug resistance protein [Synergistaceae bacterium]|jgi:multicomponent Na+:H+ antiporter subunit B|nr:MAG: Multiple resistance/pH regulation related protein A [Synergistales bacterium 57_84]KUK86193.1 MAG: Multiple resistance/pH regulation related protein A [Synergistales bacterium 58_81]HBG13792.1 multidrug resistance protein [Synergistaceae bacterium]HCP07893.1 multidrug resistance protein [Synergistaceae bacterium]HCR38744.1 multidrug resistance protein [Synergistaceae bacterium]